MYKRILVPVDGSETSNKALLVALELAALKGGQVRLVHALDELAHVAGYPYSAQLRSVVRDAGLQILQRALAIADAAEVSAETCLLESAGGSRLGEMVAQEARQWAADLIVVGTHGRRGVTRALLGSGAEQVIRLAPVPVLTVPGHAGA
ncbi:MAG: UspA domain protein [Ramlibacter sp.]|jgi:nucleotide-binding universal stress UspA family protein|nr:UspA domain protein [Ramlibacter sp.]MDB5912747.1 UspA domain protein [Ramlibacter sp.]